MLHVHKVPDVVVAGNMFPQTTSIGVLGEAVGADVCKNAGSSKKAKPLFEEGHVEVGPILQGDEPFTVGSKNGPRQLFDSDVWWIPNDEIKLRRELGEQKISLLNPHVSEIIGSLTFAAVVDEQFTNVRARPSNAVRTDVYGADG